MGGQSRSARLVRDGDREGERGRIERAPFPIPNPLPNRGAERRAQSRDS